MAGIDKIRWSLPFVSKITDDVIRFVVQHIKNTIWIPCSQQAHIIQTPNIQQSRNLYVKPDGRQSVSLKIL